MRDHKAWEEMDLEEVEAQQMRNHKVFRSMLVSAELGSLHQTQMLIQIHLDLANNMLIN